MPKWLRIWLVGLAVYLSVHWLGGTVFGLDRHGPYHSLPALAFGSLAFGGVLSWLQTAGRRAGPPQDTDTGAGGPPA